MDEKIPKPRDTMKRLDPFTRFLNPPTPEGEESYYNRIRPLVSKFNSISFLQREDVPSFVRQSFTAKVMLSKGQDVTCRRIMSDYITELGLSMSIEGWFGEEIVAANKLEYTQTQNLHEYQHQPKRKGWFRRGE